MSGIFHQWKQMQQEQEPDEYPIQTNEPCPFCGRLIEWSGSILYCQPCQTTWPDFQDLRIDRMNARIAAYQAAQAAQAADDQRQEDECFYNGEVAASIDRWEW